MCRSKALSIPGDSPEEKKVDVKLHSKQDSTCPDLAYKVDDNDFLDASDSEDGHGGLHVFQTVTWPLNRCFI